MLSASLRRIHNHRPSLLLISSLSLPLPSISLHLRHNLTTSTLRPFHSTPFRLHDHHHDHHHHDLIDRSSKEGTRITVIGLASNVALTVGKGVGGVMWGSASLLADAVHSLLDLVSDFVTLFTFRKARSGRDALFPYGYGKLEPLGSLTISGILLFGGLGTGYHSLDLLRTLLLTTPPFPTDTLLLTTPSLLSVLAFAAIAASIAVKEILFWTTMKVAKRTGSDVLMANAWHHRADSVSSFVALVGVGGAVVGMPILDPVGGILVSGLIVQASLTMLFPALRELVDRAPQDILTKATAILTEVQQQERNIIAFNSVRGRKMGPDLFIDLQLQVNPRISVSQSHQISENVRYAILTKVPRVTEVLIHVDVEEHDHTDTPISTPLATSKIEHDIATFAMSQSHHEVKKITHLHVHFLAGGLEVDAEIIPVRADAISFLEAVGVAKRFRDKLMEYEGVVGADVHLEATEHGGKS